jgi:hypothetical protein
MTVRNLTLGKQEEKGTTPPAAKSIVLYEKQVQTLTVSTPTGRTGAIELLKEIKERKEQIVDFFKDMKRKAHEAWKAITEKESGYLRALDGIEKSVKQTVLKYDQEQEGIRLAEERRLQEIADKEAERERAKLLAAAAKTRSPEKKQELKAQAQAVEAHTVEVAPSLAYEQGESTRLVWKARVVNEALIPRKYLIVNDKLLQTIAREAKEQASIPGVEFYSEASLAIGRAG